MAVSDNKRPAKFALTPAGYALAERLAPLAGIQVHVRLPSSSYGSAGGLPSSSSRNVAAGAAAARAARPLRNADEHAYFPDLGAAFGASTSDPSILRNTAIHVAAPRKRQATPDLFAEREAPAAPAAGADDEDADFQRQMRRALELSRQEAIASSSGAEDFGTGSGGLGLNGRKAAMGMYAAAPPKATEVPVLKNVGEWRAVGDGAMQECH